jgi:hypothetical protein
MAHKSLFTIILAISGTVLVWFPILAPILLAIPGFLIEDTFNFDYLMPAELFPIALAGGLLLLWAAWRARAQRKLIGWSLATAILMPFLGAVIANLTGLANGEIEPTGWQWALVLASLAGYCLALLAIGVGGFLLLRQLFRRPVSPT